MPIGTITMMLANVGLQIYNNWCSSRQNEQLRQKREEFEQAALERNTQRMWQIMREDQAITLELEKQKHQQRLKDLQGEVDNILRSMANSATINNWPLNVLPIVMKNQTLGNLIARQEETIAMHCILTPSNCCSFNTSVFPLIEEAIENYCNQYWSIASDHPILFYSGAWKSNTHPTEVQIASMRTALSNLPILLITPEFRPTDGKLVFQVRIWGVGASSSDEFTIPEIEPTKFQRNYTFSLDYINDKELVSEILEDLVPYIQCVIGYLADTYFWSSMGKAPHLPLLVTNGTINTDGMNYLISESREFYDRLLTESEEKAKENMFMQENLLNLYEGSAELWNEETVERRVEGCLISFCERKTNIVSSSLEEAIYHYSKTIYNHVDIDFFIAVKNLIGNKEKKKIIEKFIYSVRYKYPNIEYCFTASQKELRIKIKEYNRQLSSYFIFEIFSPNIIYGIYNDKVRKCEDLNHVVFFCLDSINKSHGVFITDVKNFRTNTYYSDFFSHFYIDKKSLERYFTKINADFNKYIKLYDGLNSQTDIDNFSKQENVIENKRDLFDWIRSHMRRKYTDFSLFKGYTPKCKKYLLLGIFKKDNDIQLEDEVLISFYDSMPMEIDKLFGNNTHYTININYYDKKE